MKEILEKYKAIITKYEIVTWDSEPSSYRLKEGAEGHILNIK